MERVLRDPGSKPQLPLPTPCVLTLKQTSLEGPLVAMPSRYPRQGVVATSK